MKDLIHELIPHAPHLGLYVSPNIPEKLVHNALHDFARSMEREDVVALFDATMLGNGKDGAVFAIDRFIFQNNDLEPAHEVHYEDLVDVDKKRGFFKGAKVLMQINRGQATFELALDVSARPKALEFLYRFLHEAMLRPVAKVEPSPDGARTAAGSDIHAVEQALGKLRAQGLLALPDYNRLMEALIESKTS